MPDPHVVALHYRLVTGPESFEFMNPLAVEYETPMFRVRLEDGTLRAEMKEHYATPEAAQEVVNPLLEAWEIAAALEVGRRGFRFQFDHPEVIDRGPNPEAFMFLSGASLRMAGTVKTNPVLSR